MEWYGFLSVALILAGTGAIAWALYCEKGGPTHCIGCGKCVADGKCIWRKDDQSEKFRGIPR